MKSVLLYQSMSPCYIIGSLFDFDKLQPQRNTLLQILGTSQTVQELAQEGVNHNTSFLLFTLLCQVNSLNILAFIEKIIMRNVCFFFIVLFLNKLDGRDGIYSLLTCFDVCWKHGLSGINILYLDAFPIGTPLFAA